MIFEEVRKALAEGGFSPEVVEKMNGILATAEARGSITEEEKQTLLDLIDLEEQAAQVEVDAAEGVAAALTEFAKEADSAVKDAEKELEQAEKELLEEIKSITPETVEAD